MPATPRVEAGGRFLPQLRQELAWRPGCRPRAATPWGAGRGRQDPPEVLPDFLRAWEAGAEVVVGVRRARVSDTVGKRVARGCSTGCSTGERQPHRAPTRAITGCFPARRWMR